MADARPFELRSFDAEVQAQADLERLRAEVRALEVERDRLRDEARREGFDLARQDALEQAMKEAAPLADVFRKAAAGVAESRAALIAEAERELIVLAMVAAARIVKTEIQAGRPVVEANLRRAIELTAKRHEVRVLLHPDDLSRIDLFLPELRREFADLGAVALEASPAVDRGGVIVRTREGSVDATIAGQLGRIERGLAG